MQEKKGLAPHLCVQHRLAGVAAHLAHDLLEALGVRPAGVGVGQGGQQPGRGGYAGHQLGQGIPAVLVHLQFGIHEKTEFMERKS